MTTLRLVAYLLVSIVCFFLFLCFVLEMSVWKRKRFRYEQERSPYSFPDKKTTPRRRMYALHPELQKRRVREAQIELKERKEEKQTTLTKLKKKKKR